MIGIRKPRRGAGSCMLPWGCGGARFLGVLRAGALTIGVAIASLAAARELASAMTTGDAPAAQQGAAPRAAMDRFSFKSLIEMRPEEISRQTGQVWALVRILPKPFVQKPLGEIREGPGPGEYHFVPYPIDNRREGIVATVAGLTGEPDRKTYDYSFIAPMGGAHFETFLRARPFVVGGLCICRIDPTKSDIDRFSSPCLIPDGWCDSVIPAFKSFRATTGPFSPGRTAANAEALKEFATGTNPLLAMTAYRLLLEAGQTNDWLADRPFKELDPTEQSALLYLLFSHLRDAWWPRIMEHVRQMVNAAETAEQLQPLTMAMELAWQPDPFRPPVQEHCQEILKCLQARAAALGSKSLGAEDLRRFLHNRGMDPVYASGPSGAGH